MKKRVVALMLSLTLAVPSFMDVYANMHTDYLVFSAPIDNTFVGRSEGGTIANNIRFEDLSGHWAHESIIHGGSLEIIRGGSQNFNPNALVSNQEALAFVVRIMGLGSEVQTAALDIQEDHPRDNLADLLYLGYMELARQNEIISDETFAELVALPVLEEAEDEAIEEIEEIENGVIEEIENEEAENGAIEEIENDEDETITIEYEVEEEIVISATDPITREMMAAFLARALVASDGETIEDIENHPQTILSFGDWETISPDLGRYVEVIASHGIMRADSNGNFNPSANITRAEMAQVLRNMDYIYYELVGITRSTGTVAAFRDNQEVTTLHGDVWRNYYIRTSEGGVDVLQHRMTQSPSGQAIDTNTVVFRNGQVGGFELLVVGDQIEYLVRAEDNIVVYVNVVVAGQATSRVQGRLHTVDMEAGTIAIRDNNDRTFIYYMIVGLYGQDNLGEYIFIDRVQTRRLGLPIGSLVNLTLVNNLVTEINFVGQPIHTLEMNGIVIYNSPEFGFLTFMDGYGNTITRQYNSNNIRVQRESHYQTGNNIGYIGQMFPNFQFNPLEAFITDLVPGDIVFMRFDPNNPNVITNISAAANYTTRHGLVSQISSGGGRAQILLQFDNNQTSWFEIPPGTFVSSQGRPASHNDIQVGDRIRLLVNQAIVGPGHMLESVLEVAIQADGHNISSIITGSLSGLNTIQQQMMVSNARPLTQLGWGNHEQVQQLNTSARDIAFYHEGQRTSLDQVNRFLGRSDIEVYIALDNSPTGERVRQVTFRNGRDELLRSDTVISADGNGNFQIASFNGTISTDSGTIVRRNGRMVTGLDISVGDFVTVSLNGGNNAALVDITPLPSVSAINIARGRILSVDQGRSFTVESMSVLTNNNWIFTPIQREFAINPSTLFLDEFGFVDPSTFIDFTDLSVVDNVYTIIYDGSLATHVISVPHTNMSVRGTIFNVSYAEADQTGVLQLRDPQSLENITNTWTDIGGWENTIDIWTLPNTIIVRNNTIIQPRDLQVGDQVRVFTASVPLTYGGLDIPEDVVPGFIVFVES